MRFKRPKTNLTRADFIIWSALAIAFVIFLVIRSCTMEPRESAPPPRAPAQNLAARPADSAAAFTIAQRALDQFADRVREGRYQPYGRVDFAWFTAAPSADAASSIARFSHHQVTVDARIRYRLSGTSGVTTGTVPVTVVSRHRHWSVSGALGLNADLWTHEPVSEARSPHVVVIGSTKWKARLPLVSRQADRAMRAVSKLWGSHPAGKVVVMLPGSPRLMDPLTGSRTAHAQPAVASWSRAAQGGSTRVTLNPAAFFAQPRLGKQILLRHELAHVVQNLLRPDLPPLWLVEGFADFVAYRGTGVPTSTVAAELMERVDRGDVPSALPDDRRFDFSIPVSDRRTAYESGWSMCQMIANRYGEAALVGFYRQAATVNGTHEQQLDRAARARLGMSGQALIAQWQDWLRGQP